MYNNRNNTVAGAIGSTIQGGMGGQNALRTLSGGTNQKGRPAMAQYTGQNARPQGGTPSGGFRSPPVAQPPVNGGGYMAPPGGVPPQNGGGFRSPPVTGGGYVPPMPNETGQRFIPPGQNPNFVPGSDPRPNNGADALRRMQRPGVRNAFGRGGRPRTGIEALRERMSTGQPIDNGGVVFPAPGRDMGRGPDYGRGYTGPWDPVNEGRPYYDGAPPPDPRYLGPPDQVGLPPQPAPSYRNDPWV